MPPRRAPAADVTIRLLGHGDAGILDDVAAASSTIRSIPPSPRVPRPIRATISSSPAPARRSSAWRRRCDYVHPDKPAELWVNEVGVAPSYRNRGIGTRLLEALFAHGRAIGCREAWLGTDESNLAARRLYAKVRGREEAMVYVTFAI